MIDWNGDGKVDPIETGLTFQLMQEEQDRRRGTPGGSGCVTAVMTCVIVTAAIVSLILEADMKTIKHTAKQE